MQSHTLNCIQERNISKIYANLFKKLKDLVIRLGNED